MVNSDRDWLSLPELCLDSIISLLPFKEAASSSAVSRRWRFLWWATRNIEFDEIFFVEKGEGSSEDEKGNQRRVFVDYFRRWIEDYQGSGAEKFRLVFSHPEDHLPEMEKFIRFAIAGKLKMLDLDFSDPSWSEESLKIHETFLQLPLYNGHEMLESLKLYSCNLPAVSGLNTFSALKSLSLGWIRLSSGVISDLLSKCPALEILCLKKCWNMGYFEVIAPNLRTLIIDKCIPARPDMIVVNAPNLRSFKYSGAVTVFDFTCCYALEEAELDLGLEQEYYEAGDLLCNMLVEISSVKTLTVCSYMLQAIPSGEEPLSLKPALTNVQHLILKTALHRDEFYGITFFLQSCPNLKLLTIDLVPAIIFPDYDPPFDIEGHAFLANGSKLTPSYHFSKRRCLRRTLSTIVVKGFKGYPNEVSVLGYLLRFGEVLNTMRIDISKEGGTDMEAIYKEKVQSLVQFRGSPHIQVDVFSSL